MLNFITLFDKNYFSRGLALYNSLVEQCENFHLYILAMDLETEEYFKQENTDNRTIISLNQIESFYPELTDIERERSRAEYCWTLTPYSIQYAIKNYYLESCTYLDADTLLYSDPKILIDEAGDNSIIITEHRYTPEYDRTKTSGKYCVQFMFFRNDKNGTEALEWWRQRCKEWCYAKFEDGKLGDQKYLDDWTTRFKGVYVPRNIGCGIAPWNVQQYDFIVKDVKIIVSDKITKEQGELIFVHYHNLEKCFFLGKNAWYLGSYYIPNKSKEILFIPYIKKLLDIERELKDSLVSPAKIKRTIITHKQSFIIFFIKNIIKSFFIKRQFDLYNKNIKERNNEASRYLFFDYKEL
jgi:hypothetical protein